MRPFRPFCRMPALTVCRIAAGAAIVLVGVAACSRQKPPSAAPELGRPFVANLHPVQGDWVVQRIDSDADSLNPVILDSTNGQVISSWINEGMLQINNDTLKLDPCLALSCNISSDQLTYTFHLRPGVHWDDGTPLTAADVKFTYDRIQDPKVDAALQRVYFANIKSCALVDPLTIRFIASRRYYKTLESLGEMQIIPEHAFQTGDPDFNKNTFARHPIGTGPYQFVRWDTGSQIVLERKNDYWGGAIHYPKRLVYEVIQEPYIAAQLLKKGEIDVFDGVSPVIWKYDLQNTPSMSQVRQIVYPFPSYNYLGFNLRQPIFADVRVRHAIDLLIPRGEMLSQIYLNQYANETSGFDPPASRDYNPAVAPTAYDPAQANQLLAEAGWKNDHGDGLLYKDGKPFSFTLLYGAGNPNVEKMVELIQESLRRAGIDLKLSRLEMAQLYEHVEDWKFDAMMGGWSLDLNSDPSQIWSGAEADLKKSSNFIGYKNPEADKLMAQANLEYDDEKRATLYRQLHYLIHNDYPACFLFNPHVILLVSDRFQNVRTFAPRPCFDISTWWVPAGKQKYGN
jgi:peptide/nickel transport system substrate-binding protein